MNVRNLHNSLLEFSDGCGIEEMDLHQPCDGKQRVKMFWRNIPSIVLRWLQDPDFKDHVVFEAEVAR